MWLQKLKEYLEGSNLIAKLQAKHDMLKRSIAEGDVALFSKMCNYYDYIYSLLLYTTTAAAAANNKKMRMVQK